MEPGDSLRVENGGGGGSVRPPTATPASWTDLADGRSRPRISGRRGPPRRRGSGPGRPPGGTRPAPSSSRT